MKTLLLTGCTGFIGAHVTRNLLEEGHKVYAIVRDGKKLTKLLGETSRNDLVILQGDLLSNADLGELQSEVSKISELDGVVHMIGGGPLTSNRKFAAAIADLNYTTTLNLVRLLETTHRLDGVSVFIYFSSMAAMGIPDSDGATIVYNESTSCNPVLPYEEVKLQTEEFLRKATEKYKCKTVVLRFPQVYGGVDDPLVQMTTLVRKGAFPVVRNRVGSLPLVHVCDAAKATCEVIHKHELVPGKYDVNVVAEGSYSYSDLNEMVRRKYGKGGTVKVPYTSFYLAAWLIETVFKIVGRPEPLNRRRLVSLTKDRVVDCRKFVETFNFQFDHNVAAFLSNGLR